MGCERMELFESVCSGSGIYLYVLPVIGLTPDPEITSPVLWTQLLTALVVGLLTAFGFQILLANLGIVIGLSALRKNHQNRGALEPSSPSVSDRPSNAIATLGFGFLLSVNLVLFSACFLGTRFSQVGQPLLGAIVGLTIWSAYLLTVVWISTRTLNSVAGFIVDQATGGIRWAVGAIAHLFSLDPEDISEEDIRTLIREEIQGSLDSSEISHILATQIQALTAFPPATDNPINPQGDTTETWEPIRLYLTETSPKNLTPKRIHQKMEKLLQSLEEDLPASQPLPELETVVVDHWLKQRNDLSEKKKQKILVEVENSWRRFSRNSTPEVIEDPVFSQEVKAQETTESLQEKLQAVVKQTIDKTIESLDLSDFLRDSPISASSILGTVLATLTEALPHLLKAETLRNIVSLSPTEGSFSLEYLLEETRTSLNNLSEASLKQAEQIRDLAIQPFEHAQNRIQSRMNALKQQAYDRADSARRTAVKALWWLFAIASTGAISSALAGTLATQL